MSWHVVRSKLAKRNFRWQLSKAIAKGRRQSRRRATSSRAENVSFRCRVRQQPPSQWLASKARARFINGASLLSGMPATTRRSASMFSAPARGASQTSTRTLISSHGTC